MDVFDDQVIHDRIADYRERDPFVLVEDDRLATLPEAFRDESYVWKDVEWVVRWYCRRPLTHTQRPAEEAFRTNSMHDVRSALRAAVESTDLTAQLESLTDLAGVDIRIASAFLHFLDPDQYVAIDDHAWNTLVAAGVLSDPYPVPPSATAYATFLDQCRRIAAQTDVRVVDVGRALWADARDA